MEKIQFVYAEVMNGITESMREDPLLAIISDGVYSLLQPKKIA